MAFIKVWLFELNMCTYGTLSTCLKDPRNQSPHKMNYYAVKSSCSGVLLANQSMIKFNLGSSGAVKYIHTLSLPLFCSCILCQRLMQMATMLTLFLLLKIPLRYRHSCDYTKDTGIS